MASHGPCRERREERDLVEWLYYVAERALFAVLTTT